MTSEMRNSDLLFSPPKKRPPVLPGGLELSGDRGSEAVDGLMCNRRDIAGCNIEIVFYAAGQLVELDNCTAVSPVLLGGVVERCDYISHFDHSSFRVVS